MNSFHSRPIRLAALLFAVSGVVACALNFHQTKAIAAGGDSSPRHPVLVELFTSEGCSSCPPADALLAHLDAAQPIPGAQVIVLSEHVTYWNQLGWRDPFSSDAMTQRQQQYSARFGLDDVYTPQMVVDGTAEMVGSDDRKVSRAIAQAAITPKVELTIADAHWANETVQFSLHSSEAANSVWMAALAEDSAQSSVSRGENSGRTLRHVAVVRAMQQLNNYAGDGRTLTLQPPTPNIGAPMRLIVFAADRSSGHILAAAEQTIRR